MLKKILVVVGALVAILVVLALMQPTEYRVERSLVMAAPPQRVFDEVTDFRRWEAWSPWAKLDPAAKNTFGGAASGKGATFAWDGNDDVGAGKMTITDVKAPESVTIDLAFIRPFEDRADVGFTLKPEGAGTHVTWWMNGKNNFVGRLFCIFMDMDKMIGGDYEKGLASMKSVVEASAK